MSFTFTLPFIIKVSMNGGGGGGDGGGVHEYCFIICFVIMQGKYVVLLLRLDRKNPMNTY